MTAAPEQAPADGAGSGGLVRDSSVVAGWTLLSRVTGLVRVVCVAAVLGPTFLANVYQSTNSLPNVVYEFLTGSLFASLLVPPLVHALDRQDVARARRLAGGFLGVVLLGFAATGLVVVAAGPAVVHLLGLGVTDPAVAADQRRVSLLLLAIVMPQLLLYGVAGIGAATMNARGRFALAAAAPAAENVGIVATLLLFAQMGGSRDVRTVTTGQLVLLGGGTTGAVALHALGQWWGARRAGVTIAPRAGWRDVDVRRIVRAGRPALGQSGLSAARMLGVLVVAGRVPGGVVAFVLAQNFFYLVTGLTARPMATALLPRLARLHQAGDAAGFRSELDRTASVVSLLAVPAACCMLVLAQPLSWAVSFGAMATPRGQTLVAVSLAAVSFGVLADAAFVVLTAASYARSAPAVPFRAMALRVALAVTGMALTLLLARGTAVLVCLGLSLVVGDVVGALVLARWVLRPLPRGASAVRPVVLRAAATGMLMGAAGLATGQVLRSAGGGTPGLLAGGGAAVVASGCFVAVHLALRTPELSEALVRRRSAA